MLQIVFIFFLGWLTFYQFDITALESFCEAVLKCCLALITLSIIPRVQCGISRIVIFILNLIDLSIKYLEIYHLS